MLTGNTSAIWKMIREVDKARPNSFKAALKKVAGLDSKDSRPHEGDKSFYG